MTITSQITETKETTGTIATEIVLNIPNADIPNITVSITEAFRLLIGACASPKLVEVLRGCYHLASELDFENKRLFDNLVLSETNTYLDEPRVIFQDGKNEVLASHDTDRDIAFINRKIDVKIPRACANIYFRYFHLIDDLAANINNNGYSNTPIGKAFYGDRSTSVEQIRTFKAAFETISQCMILFSEIHSALTFTLYLPSVEI